MSHLRTFGADQRGNVILVFAFAIFAIGMVVGAAVDLTRASSSKTHLQDVTDAAVLAAAKAYYANGSKPEAQRVAAAQSAADAYMTSMVSSRSATLLNPTWTVSVSPDGVVTLLSQGASPAYLGGFFGIKKLNFSTQAVAKGGAPRLEVVLVLDNTGSMKGKKLQELKKAATGLVETLEQAAANSTIEDPLKLGLVPFSMTVNVGPQYRGAAWIDNAGAASIHRENYEDPKKTKTRFNLFDDVKTAWAGCVERRPAKVAGAWADYDVLEKAPVATDADSLYVPYFAPDEPDTGGTTYNNYLDDGVGGGWSARQRNLAKYAKKPKNGTGGLGNEYTLGPNAGCDLAPIARLSANTSGVKTTIKNMVAVGNTDVAFGLMWGWHLVSPNAPFKDAKPYGAKNLSKIVILMTDGDNANQDTDNANDSIYSGLGYIPSGRIGITSGNASARVKAMDDRLAKLCANMKTQGVEIYTMRVEVKGSGSTVLQGCASEPSNYYEVANASDMDEAFDKIATSIMELHLAK